MLNSKGKGESNRPEKRVGTLLGGRVGEVEAAFDAIQARIDGLDLEPMASEVAMHGRQIALDRGEPCRHVAQSVLKARLAGVEPAHVFEQQVFGCLGHGTIATGR